MPRHERLSHWSEENFDLVLAQLDEPHRALAVALLWTGARLGQLLSLRVSDIVDDGGSLRSEVILQGRYRQPKRCFPLVASVRHALGSLESYLGVPWRSQNRNCLVFRFARR